MIATHMESEMLAYIQERGTAIAETLPATHRLYVLALIDSLTTLHTEVDRLRAALVEKEAQLQWYAGSSNDWDGPYGKPHQEEMRELARQCLREEGLLPSE